MIFCHSLIDLPYFFSIEEKYEAGPLLAQGADVGSEVIEKP